MTRSSSWCSPKWYNFDSRRAQCSTNCRAVQHISAARAQCSTSVSTTSTRAAHSAVRTAEQYDASVLGCV
eukprot:3937490-Rhodomonas_salina.1